ncbi:MAG: phage holin family protein [Sporocytophaga sp.]|uniref:phage holin family protein n=1 Tax=Sporocytophaga sp. TaxID=2231183 RepID=UPI001B0BECB4|nr:phage holin family protein [Sporocytophaga sp.]MBO9699123.1 phage holin family protein [Sporocytophaga sp.]
MHFIIHLLVDAFAVWLVSAILPGVSVKSFGTALWVAILLGLINATLGWLLKFLAFPLNWLTLGLVNFIISVFMIMLVDKLVKGFEIKNFWWAVIFAILISVVNNIVFWIF